MTALHLPEAFRVRPPTRDDAERVSDLVKICQRQEWGGSDITTEDVLALWNSPEVDQELDTRLIFDPDNQLVAYAHLMRREAFRMSVILRIHPDYVTVVQRSELLAWAEERVRQLIPSLRADARISLNTTSSALADPTAREAIEQAGMVFMRSTLRMEITMSTPPPPPDWPAGISLRPFTLDMAEAVYAADDEAFSDHWGYTSTSFEVFTHIFLKSPGFDPTLWFVPVAHEEIAGTAFCEQRQDAGFVNSLSIRRHFRRQGLGLALLQHIFGEFYRRGEHKVALFVDAQSLTGATRLYERAGMQVTRRFDMYEKELRAGIELSTQEIKA